jgi:hypothetical protein
MPARATVPTVVAASTGRDAATKPTIHTPSAAAPDARPAVRGGGRRGTSGRGIAARTGLVLYGLVVLASTGVVQLSGGPGRAPAAAVAVAIVVGFAVPSLVVTGYALRWPWLRALWAADAPTARGTGDRRPPVVYLHPFGTGATPAGAQPSRGTAWQDSWYEARVARAVRTLGPVVAVGGPDDGLPTSAPRPGRAHASDDRWQQRVLALTGRAALVLLPIGTADTLAWELTHLIRQGRPDRIVLCLGDGAVPRLIRPLRPYGRTAPARHAPPERYPQFAARFGELFPRSLPAAAPGSALIVFLRDWTPVPSAELRRRGSGHPLFPDLLTLHNRLMRPRLA